mmetsp:Transcript_21685/g.43390  ORF Transcript_21685/g.43390 Transcript_21685/m.43390 type:complete len:505 (+) Transcript_21685:97-1611(+)
MANCSSAEEEAAAITSIQNQIQDLESQLQIAHDTLANLTGRRPAKRAKVDRVAPIANGNAPKTSPPQSPPPPPDARIIRYELQQYIETLQEQLKRDYFEGYEEQWETKLEWYESLRDPLQVVLDAGVVDAIPPSNGVGGDTTTYGGVGGVGNGKTAYLKECNDILKMVADSFDALMACGARMDTRLELRESEASFDLRLPWVVASERGKGENGEDGMHTFLAGNRVENTWGWVWVAMLRSHANHLERLRLASAESSSVPDSDQKATANGDTAGKNNVNSNTGNTSYALDRYEKVILQCLRDMHGYLPKGKGCISMNGPLSDFFSNGSPEDENAVFDSTDVEALRKRDMEGVPDGEALAKLIKEKVEEWSKMKCDKKTRIVMTRIQYGLESSDDDDNDDDDDDDDDENDDGDDDLEGLNETYDESGDDGDGGDESNLNESNIDEDDEGNDELNVTFEDFDEDGNDELNKTFEDSDGQILDEDDDNEDGDDSGDGMPGIDDDAGDY